MKEIKLLDNNRILYFDILRILACSLVLLTHSAMPAVDMAYGPFYAFFSTLAAPSSELFLCISGAILLPVTKSLSEFYKRRFTKLVYPVLFWSILMSFFFCYYGEYDINMAFRKLLLLPFKPVHGVYWFVYAICGLYLIAPFISRWLISSTQKELQLFLMLWVITQTLPLLNYFHPNLYELNGSYYSMFSSFGGFMGYMILGFYLRKYPIVIKGERFTLLTTILVTLLLFMVVFFFKINDIDTSILTDNLSLFSTLAVVNIFTFIQIISKASVFQKIALYLAKIAKYSFGIYLCHMIVIRMVWKIFAELRMHPVIETPLICLLSLFISYIIIRLFSKLPFSKFTVGI